MCDNIIGKNTDSIRQGIDWGQISGAIFDLLFRLYNENLQKKPEIAIKALDYIDFLIEKRIGFPDFVKELDRL